MANNGMPYVAIIGGIWNFPPEQAAEARKAAEEFGEALAQAGMGLVVYFSNDESLEPHVVRGYVRALPQGGGAGSILVRFAQSQRKKVKFPEQETRPELFKFDLFPSEDWEAPFYRSLVDAEGVDAVMLMAGARSTLIAGQIAVARPLPVLAIDRFGGSAGVIWTELAGKEKGYPAETDSPTAAVAWLKNKCVERAQRREEDARLEARYRRAVSQKNKTFWAICALVVLLTFFFFGMAWTPAPNIYAFLMFLTLVAAGATGALVRSAFWGSEETPPAGSLLFGGFAGIVVGAAYLIPQWIGAPGVLEPSATVVAHTDKIQFVAAAVVAITAGVGFDTIFNRLREEAKNIPTQVPGRT